MTKPLDHYLKKYQELHAGTGTFIVNGKEYFDEARRLFDGSNFYEKLWEHFCPIALKRKSFRVLDYGCGKAKHLYQPHLDGKTFYASFPGKVQEYYCFDPGNAMFAKRPGGDARFDFLICADVMEHIPDEHVDDSLAEMRAWTEKDGVAFFSISGQDAKKCFDDGENLHVNVQPLEYWIAKLDAMRRRYVLVYTGPTGSTIYKRL